MTSRTPPTGPGDTGDRGTGGGARAVTVTLDGAPCTGLDGQSLAAVLLGAGHLGWRRGPSGAPRGLFCGIGVCFDCLVTVNGDRDVRACRRPARDGDTLTTQTREESPDAARGSGEAPEEGS